MEQIRVAPRTGAKARRVATDWSANSSPDRLVSPGPPHDVDDGVLAQPEFTADQAIAPALGDEGENLRCEAVRLRPLPGLAAETLAARLRSRDAGADAFLGQLALELGDAGEHGRHHPPVRHREIEGHAVQRDQRHAPGFQLAQRGQEVAGNERLRTLLVVGATAVVRHAKPGGKSTSAWLLGLLERKPRKLVAVALANKMARIVWAMMARGEAYRRQPVAA
jgi:hypothetical protein